MTGAVTTLARFFGREDGGAFYLSTTGRVRNSSPNRQGLFHSTIAIRTQEVAAYEQEGVLPIRSKFSDIER